MNLSRPFILRPVATSLLMLAVLLSGALAYRQLPLSALPEVDYPTIQVVTLYPGASPEVMTSSVTAPLERQFGQMPGLNQMSSSSSGGASVITLQFSLNLTLDVAEQQVQAAINAASSLLPTDLPAPPIYNKVNPADTPIVTLAITSKTLPLAKVQDLVDTRLAQKLSQLPGVGLVSISGGVRPAVRIQANPKALAAYGLNLDDIRVAIGSANVNAAKGSFDGAARASTIDANDQIRAPEEYRNLIIGYKNGAPIRLIDVADVIDGAENSRLAGWSGTEPGADRERAAPAGRQRDRGGEPHQGATAAAAGVAPRDDRSEAPHRPHGHDPRLGARRAGRAALRHRAGGDGDLPVPAQHPRDPHPERGGAAVAGRHLRRDVPGRLQHQQPHADGADHRHRLRGRRRHRHDREHLALHREGRGPDGRRA